jgi:hypothetical protein
VKQAYTQPDLDLFRRLARDINAGVQVDSDKAAPFCALGWMTAQMPPAPSFELTTWGLEHVSQRKTA